MICSTEKRFFFTTKPPSHRLNFVAKLLFQLVRGPNTSKPVNSSTKRALDPASKGRPRESHRPPSCFDPQQSVPRPPAWRLTTPVYLFPTPAVRTMQPESRSSAVLCLNRFALCSAPARPLFFAFSSDLGAVPPGLDLPFGPQDKAAYKCPKFCGLRRQHHRAWRD
jgi:hypothetical protein